MSLPQASPSRLSTFEDGPPHPGLRRAIWGLIAAQVALFFALGNARFSTFHNQTFDLAFYTRISWGLTHQEFWEPMVNAHVFGLHLSPILIPLALLGELFGTPRVLLFSQALAFGLAAIPLSRIGRRHLGPIGAFAAAVVWLFHPNLSHVASYEFHPGSVAILPLAWLAYAVDRGSTRALALGTLATLACREDLALVTAGLGLLFFLKHRSKRREGAHVILGSIAYAAFFFLVLHPLYAPAEGSLQLHFGRFGQSPLEVLIYLLTHPVELLGYLSAGDRLLYLPKILLLFCFLPLLRPLWFLPVAPIVAINLLSEWPTIRGLDAHYLTPALPFLLAASLQAIGKFSSRAGIVLAACLTLLALGAHFLWAASPFSLSYAGEQFRYDARSRATADLLELIPPEARVQAPDPLLAHLAERSFLHRASSPEAGAEFLVLDVSHRQDYVGNEDLLRTLEEPTIGGWLGRDDHSLVYASPFYLLLHRGHDPRDGLGGQAIVGTANVEEGVSIASCLSFLSARVVDDTLAMDFAVQAPCPRDLAFRIGVGERPRRVDLPFGGLLSPAHLRAGDRVRSLHHLSADERLRAGELRMGALRQSGARPEHADPVSIPLNLL